MSQLNHDILFRVPMVYPWGGGLHVSPDGRSIVCMWNESGQWQLYVLPVDGSREAQPVTSGPESKMYPRYSPDGAKIAFLQDYSGDEKFDVHVLDLNTGQLTNMMPDTDEGLNDVIRWSPDGRTIYFTSNRAGRFVAYALSFDDGSVRRMTQHEYSDLLAEPSPDGQWLAVSAMLDGQNDGIFLVPTAGGPVRRVGQSAGLHDATGPAWSPDSRRLAFVSADKGMSDVGLYDLGTDSIAWITDSRYECYSPRWSPRPFPRQSRSGPPGASDRLVYLANRDGNMDIVLHDLDRGPQIVPMLPGLHLQPCFTPDGSTLVFTYSGPAHPPDLWSMRLADRRVTQLTNSLPKEIDRAVFVGPTHIRYPSLDPGVSIPALLYIPKDLPVDTKPPAVIYVHGGPTAQFDNDWYSDVQDLVTRGYVVLCPNYRGSIGYGKAFREANRFDLGRGDANDCAAGADYLINTGIADPKRIGITGISYGGFMTMACVTKYPDKWAAGSALVPFVNWFTEHANEREDLQYWDEQNMGDPVKDHDRWYENSPIFFIDRITAPIQLFAGGNDPRCPVNESEQVRDELVKLGRPVELHVYWDEGHVPRKLDNRVDVYKKRAAFLDRYLKP